MPAVTTAGVALAIDVPPERMDDFRLMLREQIADDSHRLHDIDEGVDSTPRVAVEARVDFLWSLAEQVGGAY